MPILLKCKICKSVFETKPCLEKVAKFCSRECFGVSKTGKQAWNKGIKRWWDTPTEFKKGNKNWNTGKSWDAKARLKMSLSHLGKVVGNNHYSWKGDNVSYSGIHHWVARWRGKPDICEHCGKFGLKGRKIHWANVDHKYKRNLADWLRLCITCHKKYDIKNNLLANI